MRDDHKEARNAWILWEKLNDLSDSLWARYESAFMEFMDEHALRDTEDRESDKSIYQDLADMSHERGIVCSEDGVA